MVHNHWLHGFNYNVEARDADGLHYETLAICRQLAHGRAVFKEVAAENPTGKFMIRRTLLLVHVCENDHVLIEKKPSSRSPITSATAQHAHTSGNHLKSRQDLPRSSEHRAHSTLHPPPANSLYHIAFHPPPCAPRPNPHSARRTAPRIHSRGFLPWRLSDAGPRSPRLHHSFGRHPKPFTPTDSCSATN